MEISASRFSAISGSSTYRDQIGRPGIGGTRGDQIGKPGTGGAQVDQIGRLVSAYQASVTGVVIGSPQWLLEQTQKLSILG